MTRASTSAALLAAVFLLATELPYTSAAGWHYGDESHWPGDCQTGKQQSPINLAAELANTDKIFNPFQFNRYDMPYASNLKNNGHSVELKLQFGSEKATVKGGGLPDEYTLDHFHFHWGSEHTVENMRYPLEMHLVHYATKYGNLSNALPHEEGVAVLGVFFELSPDNDEAFEPLVQVISIVEKSVQSSKTLPEPIRISDFLPRNRAGFYRYFGSLTTPGCNEIVVWTLFTNTVPISKRQVAQFEAIWSSDGPLKENYRKLQDLNGRALLLKVSPLRPASAMANVHLISPIALALLCLMKLVH